MVSGINKKTIQNTNVYRVILDKADKIYNVRFIRNMLGEHRIL